MANVSLSTKNREHLALRLSAGAAVLMFFTANASAQQAEAAPLPTSAASDAGRRDTRVQSLDTVIVSATRRRELARDVPVQIDVLSASKLQDAGAKTMSDYLSNVPGVNVNTTGGAGGNSVTIRGISAGQEIAPLVGVYVDDVAIGSTSAWLGGARSAFDMSLLDLNHIEVLKGPQGTLYGASAMGGLIKYITNSPDTYDFTGHVSLGAARVNGGGSANTASAVLNVPLSEGLAAVRLAGFSDKAPGYVDQIGLAPLREASRGSSNGLRLSALIEPTAKFRVKLTAMRQNAHSNGSDLVPYDPSTMQPILGRFVGKQDVQQPSDTRTTLATADLEYGFDWATLNSITSTQRRNYGSTGDNGLYAALLPELGIQTATSYDANRLNRTTQEFRLTSKAGHELDWIVGLYLNREQARNAQGSNAATAGGAVRLIAATIPSTFRESAVYGDVTWSVNRQLAVTAGLRVARNKQTFQVDADGILIGPTPTSVTNESSETAKTYLLTVRYALTPQSNVYLRAANGYRPGGPNSPIYDATGTLLVPPTYSHDSLWSYEAGYKAELLDKTLSLSTSIFNIRWKDLQQYGSAQGISYLTNGGKAEVNGAEFAATLAASRHWKLSTAIAWSEGKTTEASSISAAGVSLPNSPKFSASLGVSHEFEIAGRPSYAGFSTRYVGARHAGFAGSRFAPDLILPGYVVTDLQAGIGFKGAHLAVYVRNAFNRYALLSASSAGLSLGGNWLMSVQQPMTIGFTLTAPF